jgi:hypothetical protein
MDCLVVIREKAFKTTLSQGMLHKLLNDIERAGGNMSPKFGQPAQNESDAARWPRVLGSERYNSCKSGR